MANVYYDLGRQDFEFHGEIVQKLLPVYGDGLAEYMRGFEFAKKRGKRFEKISMREAVRLDKKHNRAYNGDAGVQSLPSKRERVSGLTRNPRKLRLDPGDW